jgi:cell division protein ZapE
VYLWGGVGRGKTLLMDFFDASLGAVPRERTHFYRFMRRVHADLRSIGNRTDPLDVVAQRFAARARVICLDEFFVADIADAMLLAGLFEGLFRYGVTLVATSNVAPRQLYKDGLQRQRFLPAIDAIEAHVEVVHLDGGIDYRLRQLQRAPIYLDSHAADSGARLQRLFTELAGEHGGCRTELQILGRTLTAVCARADVVWFDFASLCEGSRSQNDYADLAQEFRTVLVADVPVFSDAEQDDAARRFIALVDEFYDQGTKLVVSAAAAPSELYRGARLQQEFQRTASRLIEMQTAAYLARSRRG